MSKRLQIVKVVCFQIFYWFIYFLIELGNVFRMNCLRSSVLVIFFRIYRRLKSKCKLILYFTPNWPISTPIVALFKYFLHYCIRKHQTNQFRRKSLLDSNWIMGNSWQQIDSIVLITLCRPSLLATAIEQVINEQWRQIRCRKILLCGILKV